MLPFVIPWMDLEGIMRSEISQTERQIPYDFTCMQDLKNKVNEQTKQNQTHRYRGHFWWLPGGRQVG